MALVLHSVNVKGNKNIYKTLIVAEYSDVKVETVENFEMGVSNKTPEFLNMNPIGKVPVLETPHGPIFESNAIARYVTRLKADNPLYGSSLIDYARIEQWIDFSTLEIDTNLVNWFRPRIGRAPYFPPLRLEKERERMTGGSRCKRQLGVASVQMAAAEGVGANGSWELARVFFGERKQERETARRKGISSQTRKFLVAKRPFC